MDKVDKVFREASKRLLPAHKGEIVAIDKKSGEYATGKTVLDAYKKALKKHLGKTFYFKRLGYDYVYFVGVCHARQI